MANSTISIRVNETLKEQAQSLFKELGMDMSTAVNIFLTQTVREQRIPFVIGVEVPNAETIAAMEEVEEMAKSGKPPRFETVDDMFKELGI